MFTVSNLANEAQVTADTVRHYVKLKLLHPQRDRDNGYKLFSRDDVSRVQFIRDAKSLGFSLKEIADIFAQSNEGNSPCPQVRERLQQHIDENRARLQELMALQERMEKALLKWNDMPDNSPAEAGKDSVCHLIESMAETETAIDE